MKMMLRVIVAISLLAGTAVMLHAQDDMNAPPKVLVIYREILKFGKDAAHQKNETAFARAYAAAKVPDRYVGATTMSGVNEAWFFTGYDSLGAWEKGNQFMDQPSVSSTMARLNEQDSDYVSDAREIVATYDEKSSYSPNINVGTTRYMEVETIRLRPGHDKDWAEVVALYKNAASKANLTEHDIFFSVRYGSQAGTILIFTPRKSLAEIDAAADDYKNLMAAMGDEGQKRWERLLESSIAFDSTELLRFDPKMSYAPESFIKVDPDFWKPKAAPAMKAAPAASTAKKSADAPK
jgi:hypothetical protein